MDKYTVDTKGTLENRFSETIDGVYFAHQPIYGYRAPYSSTSTIARYMVTKSILNALNKYHFKTFADIGGAEGYTANLVRTIFNVEVTITDLSEGACKMAREIFQLNAIPADIHKLPFSDNEFDAVLCSETIEHVTDYKKAIAELLRITKHTLVITVPHETEEIVARNIAQKVPHGHIHYFDTRTLDFLNEMGYNVKFEKTLSPLLIVPRVLVEGFKKPDTRLHFKIYNLTTPLLKKLFGLKTANQITDLDVKMTRFFGFYQGITFIIEKDPGNIKKTAPPLIKARNFTNIKVHKYYPASKNQEPAAPADY